MVVPARNESSSIVPCLERLSVLREDLVPLGVEMTLLVVINNSSDDTESKARSFSLDAPWICVETTEGRGKGLAVMHGWSFGVDLVGFTDADLAADISVVPALVKRVMDGDAMAVASRYCSSLRPDRSLYRSTVSRIYRVVSRLTVGIKVADAQCGLKIADYSAIKNELSMCEETGWLLDSELIFHLSNSDKVVSEIPVSWVAGAESQLRFWPTSLQVVKFLSRLYRLKS